jgi:hypothetical protein
MITSKTTLTNRCFVRQYVRLTFCLEDVKCVCAYAGVYNKTAKSTTYVYKLYY